MLNFDKIRVAHGGFDGDHLEPMSQYGWRWMLGSVFRFKKMVAVVTLCAVALALIFVIVRPATYTATAHLQLTNLRLTFSRDDAFFAETQLDPTFIETQIQILRSERIALGVVDNLKLADQAPEKRSNPLSALLGEIGMLFDRPPADSGVAGSLTDARAAALKVVQRGLSAERVALSNVVELKFTAPDAEEAARITNDIVRAYVVDQNMARLDAAQAGSSWLRERLREVGPKTRIIAAAMPPADKSNVRGLLVIAVAGVLGGAAAVALAIARSFLDGRIRTPEQAVEATRATFLGVVPTVPALKSNARPKVNKELLAKGKCQLALPNAVLAKTGKYSDLWHTMRNARFASDAELGDRSCQMIGVTSLVRGEGCSTIASNLALSLAASRQRTLLVDADGYGFELSKRFGLAEERGLIEYAAGRQTDLAKYVKIDQDSGLHVLPLGGQATRSFDWPEQMNEFLVAANASYDYVIFDLPPMTMVGDIRAAAHHMHGFIVVVGWGAASVEQMQVGLSSAQGVHAKLIGCIVNKIDLRSMKWMPSRELDFIRLRKRSG